MTDAELAAIRAENAERRKRKDAATPGPWLGGCNYQAVCLECGNRGSSEHAPGCSGKHVVSTASDAAINAAAHSDPVEDRIDALLAEVERLKAAILAEREACASLAEKTLADGPDPWDHGDKIAAAIRARP